MFWTSSLERWSSFSYSNGENVLVNAAPGLGFLTTTATVVDAEKLDWMLKEFTDDALISPSSYRESTREVFLFCEKKVFLPNTDHKLVAVADLSLGWGYQVGSTDILFLLAIRASNQPVAQESDQCWRKFMPSF